MMTLDDQLNEVAKEMRAAAHSVAHRPWVEPERSTGGRRAFAAVSAAALVVALVALPTLIFGGTEDIQQISDPVGNSALNDADVSSPPNTNPAAVTTVAPIESTGDSPDAWDPLGLNLDGWTAVQAWHSASGSSIFYDSDTSDTGDRGRVAIEIWSDQPGTEPGSGYEHALSNLEAQGDSLGDVTVRDNATAAAYTFRDPNTESAGFAFIWAASPTVSVEVLAYVDTLEEATEIVESIEPLSDFEWNTILDEVGEAPGDGVTTSTSIAP